MSLKLAVLIPALVLVVMGACLLVGPKTAEKNLKSFPRSRRTAYVGFGSAAIWFLLKIWTLSPADFGENRTLFFWIFAATSLLAFKYAPDFLAVRGLCALVLLSANPLLHATFMNFDCPGLYLQKVMLYLCIIAAILLAGQPWRVRDFFDWFFAEAFRVRRSGWALLAYGLGLGSVVLFI